MNGDLSPLPVPGYEAMTYTVGARLPELWPLSGLNTTLHVPSLCIHVQCTSRSAPGAPVLKDIRVLLSVVRSRPVVVVTQSGWHCLEGGSVNQLRLHPSGFQEAMKCGGKS